MRHHTVTATFSAPPDEVFAYLANIDNLPHWATDFARELKLVDGRHKIMNGLGEFFFEIHADRGSGVIDMLAGPREEELQPFRRGSCRWAKAAAPSPSPCSRRPDSRTSNSRASTSRSCASSRTSSCCSAKRSPFRRF